MSKVKTGGRKAGTPNKINKSITEKLNQLDCCPITALVAIAKEAHEAKDLSLAANVYKDLLQYVSAKLKPVEDKVVEEKEGIQVTFVNAWTNEPFDRE